MLSFSYYLDLVRSAVIWAYVAGVAVTVACGKVIDWGTVPIRYLAYYLWAVLSFVLSPLWFVADLGRSAAAQALDLAVRLRYIYVFFACAAMIGLLTAFLLHGTSSLLFVLLRLHPAQQPPPASKAPASPGWRGIAGEYDDDDDDDDDDDFGLGGAGSSSAFETGASSSQTLVASSSGGASGGRLRNRTGARTGRLDVPAMRDLYGPHWRALSDQRKAPVKSRHRGKLKGLLAQTIHEESSESESL